MKTQPPNPPKKADQYADQYAGSDAARAAPSAAPDLPPALHGEHITLNGMHCYVAGNGPPLVLVHSINAAPSAAEMRPLFDHYRASHTVFAPDLPGFGLSDRADRRYDPRLMTDALHALAAQVRLRCGAAPIAALAASMGCEFLARAAVEQPTQWGRLAFVSPTGLEGSKPRRGPPGSTRAVPGLHRLLANPLWAQAWYRGLTQPAVRRYFLRRTWGSKAIDETLWAYAVCAARQPGARFAPLHFLSGGLFSQDIHRIYEALQQPVWMSHGVRGDFKDFRAKRLVPWCTTAAPLLTLRCSSSPRAGPGGGAGCQWRRTWQWPPARTSPGPSQHQTMNALSRP